MDQRVCAGWWQAASAPTQIYTSRSTTRSQRTTESQRAGVRRRKRQSVGRGPPPPAAPRATQASRSFGSWPESKSSHTPNTRTSPPVRPSRQPRTRRAARPERDPRLRQPAGRSLVRPQQACRGAGQKYRGIRPARPPPACSILKPGRASALTAAPQRTRIHPVAASPRPRNGPLHPRAGDCHARRSRAASSSAGARPRAPKPDDEQVRQPRGRALLLSARGETATPAPRGVAPVRQWSRGQRAAT